jgi:hypothetical protein
MATCNLETNRADCNCTYDPCPRKGKCCECLRYHWSNQELPACLFPDHVEKTWDRSLRRFISTHQK